ncbi:hypothetical protein PHJA_001370800 [Phtheirospermum japonicum]|uniref:Uncharacterized protein n=1 Tax=Phtheirospermum japonicum TaxID=374723 RepID=A0A830BW60_9LAMI|nr:hypothetical protein PHJA_001370800 [Phtheirospermum japonicum]
MQASWQPHALTDWYVTQTKKRSVAICVFFTFAKKKINWTTLRVPEFSFAGDGAESMSRQSTMIISERSAISSATSRLMVFCSSYTAITSSSGGGYEHRLQRG